MKKILFILNSLNCGGEENFVMNLYRIMKDRDDIEVLFAVPDNGCKQYFEDEILKNGTKIYKFPSKLRRPVKCFTTIKRIVQKEKISVVHRHSENSLMYWDLLAAKYGGADVLIAHSHSSKVVGAIYKMLHHVFIKKLSKIATKKYACSEIAGKWMYGDSDFEVINNGIDLSNYKCDKSIRLQLRQANNIKDADILIGHVGRLNEVKNHRFLIEVFDYLVRNTKKSYKLIIVGDGELRDSLRNQVDEAGLRDKVIFTGMVNNVNEYLQAIDILVFPSLYEGLPVSLIEAQAAGIPCVISDTISSEVRVTPLVKFCSLKQGCEEWAQIIDSIKLEQADYSGDLRDSGYDISEVVNNLCDVYRK